MNNSLSTLEKFGVLARKFLHDSSNDLTALSLNLHFLEKAIEPEHPAYKDFQNFLVIVKNLQANTRQLLNWRRQLQDNLQNHKVDYFYSLLPKFESWTLQDETPKGGLKNVRIHPQWITSLLIFFCDNNSGSIQILLQESPNDQCATPEQLSIILKTRDLPPLTPEIEWELHREIVKLLGGGISIEGAPPNKKVTLFLPVYLS